MINGLRVKQAREISKLTQTDLAKRLKITQSTVGKLESDIKDCDKSLVEQLALLTGFPVSFFSQGLSPDFPLGTLLFRCRAKIPMQKYALLFPSP